MRQSLVTGLAATLMALSTGNLVAAPKPPPPRVSVRVFDTSAQPVDHLQAALNEAAALVAGAGVQIDWRICQAGGSNFGCTSLVGERERVVRVVSAPRGPVTSGRIPLGNAVLDPGTGTGVLATVYFDRVAEMSSANECDQSTLLGRTIAHELGHLLLGTNAHSRAGLMRAVWTTEELRLNRPQDWRFSDADAARIGRHGIQ